MATGAKLKDRIDFDLRIARLMIEDLPELEQTWPEETPENQFIAMQEWENTLAQLRSLRDARQHAQMTDDQQRRYEGVLASLRAARPILDRLGLVTPSQIAQIMPSESADR